MQVTALQTGLEGAVFVRFGFLTIIPYFVPSFFGCSVTGKTLATLLFVHYRLPSPKLVKVRQDLIYTIHSTSSSCGQKQTVIRGVLRSGPMTNVPPGVVFAVKKITCALQCGSAFEKDARCAAVLYFQTVEGTS